MLDPLPIEPLSRTPNATISLPGSKSITNRALLVAGLAEGATTLEGALIADDTLAMVDGLRALGISCEVDHASSSINVVGCGNFRHALAGDGFVEVARIDARRSGTTARFLMAVAALRPAATLIDGDAQLRSRPFAPQMAALRGLGVEVVEVAEPESLSTQVELTGETLESLPRRATNLGHLPVVVRGPIFKDYCTIDGSISSQFASGLLLAGGPGRLTVEFPSRPVSWPYLQMTLDVMEAFGAQTKISKRRPNEPVKITVGGGYVSPGVYQIEPDASAASYFLAAAAITGGRVRIDGLGSNSIQGDVGFAQVLGRMGAEVSVGCDHIEVIGRELRGVEVDLRDISDTAPTLGVVAAFAKGATKVSGIGFVRHKESDRSAGIVAELRRCGVDATLTDDGFEVWPNQPPRGAIFETYEDHRMAMALALVGLVVEGVRVRDPECVAKTFPNYFDALDQLRQPAPPLRQPAPPHAASEHHKQSPPQKTLSEGSPNALTNTTPHATYERPQRCPSEYLGRSLSTSSVSEAVRVIAIDGPAGSGKTTVAKALAAQLGLAHLDTGAMYRAVAFAVLSTSGDPEDAELAAKVARAMELALRDERVIVNGIDATLQIRGPEVTRAVVAVAANPEVRKELVSRQREWVMRRGGGVLEGRDIGTVVFPDAELKIYLTADSEVRTRRRVQEAPELDSGSVSADLAHRDKVDSTREASPLSEATNSVWLDTSKIGISEVVDKIMALLSSRSSGT